MKILREKRGFTTNSSSAADWNEPEAPRFDKDGNLIIKSEDLKTTTTEKTETQKSSLIKDNLVMISVLVASVIGLFVLERFIRRILKRKKLVEDVSSNETP